jgi:multidrug efflux system membrane fusion protein
MSGSLRGLYPVWRPVACILVGVAWLAGCSRAPEAPQAVRAVRTWRAQAVEPGGGVEFAAEVRARNEAALGFQVGGKLLSREVQLGESVKAGQVLARLDPADLRLAQRAAEAATASAQTQWAQAQADYRRFEALQAQGFISAAELERRKSALDAARAQHQQALASSALQGNQSAHAVLRSPGAGVITSVLADPGTVLAAGTPVLRLAQAGPRDAVFSVPEDRVARVRALLGMADALRVRVAQEPQARPATLRELAAAADPATRTFLAKADLASADQALNQTATVMLPAEQGATDTLLVPLVAVAERDGRSVVWRLDPATMTVQPQPVTIVESQGDRWRVRGVRPDAELVTAGLHVLQPGQKVQRLQADPTPAAVPASAAR